MKRAKLGMQVCASQLRQVCNSVKSLFVCLFVLWKGITSAGDGLTYWEGIKGWLVAARVKLLDRNFE